MEFPSIPRAREATNHASFAPNVLQIDSFIQFFHFLYEYSLELVLLSLPLFNVIFFTHVQLNANWTFAISCGPKQWSWHSNVGSQILKAGGNLKLVSIPNWRYDPENFSTTLVAPICVVPQCPKKPQWGRHKLLHTEFNCTAMMFSLCTRDNESTMSR